MVRLNARQLRTTEPPDEAHRSLRRQPVHIVLDNVLDTYNIGSVFRLADAVAAEKLWLCGETPAPPNTRIRKASVNTWKWIPWEQAPSAVDAINQIKSRHSRISVVAVEQDRRSIPYRMPAYKLPVAVVVGNETFGVSKPVLDLADIIVELPMWGINNSLNVMVSLGIVLYEITKVFDKRNPDSR
ncbi:hypothetical protein A2Z33_00100 [Candidatus Gottesmanbacteria bacterium RBG_16_52_11]|uniref:tRNA/rRNA methyltransferase SpoU type domain-containing protein n=1 Tax=Candidatus Gottesmanbacteria bacterium RBG_16_52_11 TaxID=1798374 RepID=A0A1F5YMZ3_9BACT|nr:MAG: hypothetical protein A2Z33_00100 [Candidatus Gottesmanbacteria bacterium RBG_16_52_11]